ncbi:Alpha-1,3-mannosyltransferase, partial [Globisporangium splendens]
MEEKASPSVQASGDSASVQSTYGQKWAHVFGISSDTEGYRARYAFLKETLVFKVDAMGNSDPLTAFMEQQERDASGKPQQLPARILPKIVRGSINADSDEESDDDDDEEEEEMDTNGLDAIQTPDSGGNGSTTTSGTAKPGWAQYFNDETLLYEINTDLDRLYPAGNEELFQKDEYRSILRHVLFVWCKLHPDVSYRQGMHDVAAVVLFSFLCKRRTMAADDESNPFSEEDATPAEYELPETAEADTFLVFEAVMLYLKPFYEIVPPSPPTAEVGNEGQRPSSQSNGEPRLFANYSVKENDDPNSLFGDSSSNASLSPSHSYANSNGASNAKRKLPALHRMCANIQYELLQQKDPQLYYHLQNLDIVPETYCLRWLRLLLAREYVFDDLLQVWNAMIQDQDRPDIKFPAVVANNEECLQALPRLVAIDTDDSSWMGFPLLRFICVAKLLHLSKQLRAADNTGCWRLLMHSAPADGPTSEDEPSVRELIRFAHVLRNPMLATRDGPEAVDVVQFEAGSLGIILTASKAPFEDRLAVKDFVDDPQQARNGNGMGGMGQAKASGKVFIGDILDSINGVPIVGITTEEVKRHIQLIGRPMYMGFLHVSASTETATGSSPSVTVPPDPVDSPELLLLPHFLPGEMCYAHVETSIQSFVLAHDGSCLTHYLSGKLYITNYRCFFTRLLGKGDIDWQVPVLSIASVEGTDSSMGSISVGSTALDHAQAVLGFSSDDSSTYKVVIRCKDTQVARLSFSNYSEYSKLYKCLSHLAFPVSLLDAFCFAYSPTVAPSEEVPFDLRKEYQRIGLLDVPERLRCIDQSMRYDLCDTYPQHLIVPSAMSDVRIKAAAAFRSHGRLPVVCWIHRGNGATISRSSQPLVGLKSARSMDDELLVRLLCCPSSSPYGGRYVIMDARGQLAAVGNKAMGKGTEIVSNYRGAKLIFMNIENIHAIRQSFQSLTSIFEPRKGANEDSSSFYSKLESSGWLRHVRLVLKASAELAHSIHNGVSVLTHCSDGWDRTAQMVSLAEMMLDPYYRTLRGFQCLIEKEWCSFGHQFGARCGHARSDANNNDQRSPVFLMWLDCVWQFLRQFPSECEFNDQLLLALADHIYSCKYGTFMFDSERQRKEIFAKHRVFSIWSEINSHSEKFTNQLYAPSETPPAVLLPSTLSKNIKLWKGYFCRWDTTIVPPVPAYQYY